MLADATISQRLRGMQEKHSDPARLASSFSSQHHPQSQLNVLSASWLTGMSRENMLTHCNSLYLRRWRVRLLDLPVVSHRCIHILPRWFGGRREIRRRRRVDDAQLRAAVSERLRMYRFL